MLGLCRFFLMSKRTSWEMASSFSKTASNSSAVIKSSVRNEEENTPQDDVELLEQLHHGFKVSQISPCNRGVHFERKPTSPARELRLASRTTQHAPESIM